MIFLPTDLLLKKAKLAHQLFSSFRKQSTGNSKRILLALALESEVNVITFFYGAGSVGWHIFWVTPFLYDLSSLVFKRLFVALKSYDTTQNTP